MKRLTLTLLLLLGAATALRAQERVAEASAPAAEDLPAAEGWSLDDCIAYALEHNTDVRSRRLQIRQQETQLSTARWSRSPALNASISGDLSFGRTLTPDNTYRSDNQTSGSLSVSASVPLFEGFRINRRIAGAKFDLSAAMEDLAGAREDVALNVMSLYLQVLYNRELVLIAERQLALSRSLASKSREEVAAGRQPQGKLLESEALCAGDSLSLTQARNELQLALLTLSQALDRESAEGFDIRAPEVDDTLLSSLPIPASAAELYEIAAPDRPALRAEKLRLRSSENDVRVARSGLYPSLSLSAGYGTGVYSRDPDRFWMQFRNYSREYVGISMQIPIFNRRSVRNEIRSARLAVENQRLRLTEVERNLRKQIEQAWYNATAARAKYRSAESARRSADTAFDYARRSAEAGRSTIYDFSEAKTRLERADAEAAQARYELLFRCKVLDYYAGRPLTL